MAVGGIEFDTGFDNDDNNDSIPMAVGGIEFDTGFDNDDDNDSIPPLVDFGNCDSDDDDYDKCDATNSKTYYDDDSDSDYEEEKVEEDDEMDCETMEECFNLQLRDAGLDLHLLSYLCNRSTSAVNSTIMRCSKLMVWLHNKLKVKVVPHALKLLKNLITKKYSLLPLYYNDLLDIELFKPATILNYNEDVQQLVNWFVVYRVETTEERLLSPERLYGINLVIKSMRKMWSKKRKFLTASSNQNTVEGLVEVRKWPIGGLKELNNAVRSQLPWAKKVCQNVVEGKAVYNKFMELLAASFYTGDIYCCTLIKPNLILLFRFNTRKSWSFRYEL